jgi:hypothetical protein
MNLLDLRAVPNPCDVPGVSTVCSAAGNVASSAVGGLAGGFFDALKDQASRAATEVLKVVITGWTDVRLDAVGDPNTGAALDTAGRLQDATYWLVGFLAVGAVLVAALRMALDRSGRPFAELARGLLILVVTSAIGVGVIQLLVEAGDLYSSWIINRSLGLECASADVACQVDAARFNQKMDLFAPAALGAGLTSPLIIIGISVFLILIAIAQILMMFGRAAALILLAGMLPIAAAAGVTGQTGQQMRGKYFSWVLALVLYKPVAATIYAAAFWQVGGAASLNSMFTGMVMFLMALVALPALMRLIAPAVGAATGGGGGALAGAGGGLLGGALGGALATGAIDRAASGGGGGGGRGGQLQPTGSGPAPPVGASAGAGSGGAAAGGGMAATGGGAAGGGTAGGAAAGAGAAAGPYGMAAVAAAEGVRKVANVGPDVARQAGGTAASGIGDGG